MTILLTGFIHLPWLPEQVAPWRQRSSIDEPRPSMNLETMATAVTRILQLLRDDLHHTA